jgi:hypothetical protein
VNALQGCRPFVTVAAVVLGLLLVVEPAAAGLNALAFLGRGCRGATLGEIDVEVGELGSACVPTVNAQSILIIEHEERCQLVLYHGTNGCHGPVTGMDNSHIGCYDINFNFMDGVCN